MIAFRLATQLPKTSRVLVNQPTRRFATKMESKSSTFRKVAAVGAVSIGAFAVYEANQIMKLDEKIREGKDPHEQIPHNWQTTFFRTIPYRGISRAWGAVTHLTLPTFLRAPVYGAWGWFFGSDLTEMKAASLEEFPSLADFFVRELKENARPLDPMKIVSPVDGKVLHFGTLDNGLVEQVKGVTYSARSFLGEKDHIAKSDEKNQVYQIVFYLAPGDYHRFHSPTDWTMTTRRHFPGELLSVNPGIVKMVRGLFVFNERVVLTGTWQHGYFSYTAVGATNVGSMKINFDKDLRTNDMAAILNGGYLERTFGGGLILHKGDEIGSFNLGSTIVLIFEAPAGFQFSVEGGQKIKVGQPFGRFAGSPSK